MEARVEISDDRRSRPRAFTLAFEGAESQALMQAMLAGDDEEAERIWDEVVQGGFGGSVDLHITNTKWEQTKW